jgi:hypothetical protein
MLSLGLGRVGDAVGGRPVSETLGAEASGESEVLRDPSAEAVIRAGLLTRLARGPAKGDLARGSSFVDFFP